MGLDPDVAHDIKFRELRLEATAQDVAQLMSRY